MNTKGSKRRQPNKLVASTARWRLPPVASIKSGPVCAARVACLYWQALRHANASVQDTFRRACVLRIFQIYIYIFRTDSLATCRAKLKGLSMGKLLRSMKIEKMENRKNIKCIIKSSSRNIGSHSMR